MGVWYVEVCGGDVGGAVCDGDCVEGCVVCVRGWE